MKKGYQTVAVGAPAEAKPKKKVSNIILNTLLILIILFGVFCSFTAFVSKTGSGVPSIFGLRPFAIQTDSMEPFFSSGDLIIDTVVKDYNELQVGDVITFWTVIQGERVLNSHRIVQIDDYDTYLSFVTKGDNNSIEDAMTVHQSEIVGKYKTRIKGLGNVIDFLQTSKGFLIVIVVPCALFFIFEVISFFRALFAFQAEKMRMQFQSAAQQPAAAPAPAAATPAPAAPEPEPKPEAPAESEAAAEPEAPAEQEAPAEPEAPTEPEATAEPEAAAEPEAPAEPEAATAGVSAE